MKRATTILTMAAALVLTAGVAWADWNPGDPHKMHYPQLPDLSPNGMDIVATAPNVLADDFLCTQSGRITDVHIWASWLNDQLPVNPEGLSDPAYVGFKLSIHDDVPAGAGVPYSHPGELLWERYFYPGLIDKEWDTASPKLYSNAYERFYDPSAGQIIGYDTQVWQYNFLIDPTTAFQQQAGRIYWLDVQGLPLDPTALLGWKTTVDPFNDDAVWGLGATGDTWNELIGPDGTSLNLAFVITPEPATMSLLVVGGLLAACRRRPRT